MDYGERSNESTQEKLVRQIKSKVSVQFAKILLDYYNVELLSPEHYKDWELQASEDGNYLVSYKGYIQAIIQVEWVTDVKGSTLTVSTYPLELDQPLNI